MKKKNMVMTGLALGTIAGGTAFVMMNKKAKHKAEDMLEFAVDETRSFFEEM